MQVVVGTLELLARDGAASAPRKDGDSGGDGADSMRVDALETQVRALAAQIEQLSQQVRALGGQPSGSKQAPDALPSRYAARTAGGLAMPPASARRRSRRGPATP